MSSVHRLTLTALAGIPEIRAGDDLGRIIGDALQAADLPLRDGDVMVVAQKIVSKSEGRLVDLASVEPSVRAVECARVTGKDARYLEVVLHESARILRMREGVIIVQHRLGYVMANAGVDQSNVPGEGRVLLLPEDPDASARGLRARLRERFAAEIGVIVNDSFGRAWRNGVVGVALGVAGVPGVADLRGHLDRHGRALRVTQVAVADELAAAASLLMGQAGEGTPVVHARGVPYSRREGSMRELLRPSAEDLFR
jgi:coenzyme F420-0:L-glutamate ligase/coenzyme F420-1:gamma-L-glutamate ligase